MRNRGQYYWLISALVPFALGYFVATPGSLAAQLAFFGSATAIGLALLWREQLRFRWHPSGGGPGPENEPGPEKEKKVG